MCLIKLFNFSPGGGGGGGGGTGGKGEGGHGDLGGAPPKGIRFRGLLVAFT